jgi:hypothetical protein
VQSLGLCFYPLLKCFKRFILLLPLQDAGAWVAEDLRMRAGLSLSYDAASRREYGLPKWSTSVHTDLGPAPAVAAVRHG